MDIRKKIYPVKTKALDLLCNLSARARKFQAEDNILIFGYPRSGSTWLMEMIRQMPGTVNLWEPLHIRNVEIFRELGFGWRQHIPEDANWNEAEEAFRRLFKGEYLNFWLTSREFPLNFCTADRMIIKFVRANSMLPWLTKKFTFKYSPIFLLRHPFAVAASQMKEGSWDYEFDGYKIPDIPFNEIYQKHASFLQTLESKSEEMVATWCMNNQVVLQNSRHNKDWTTVHYERLLLHPERELRRIFECWGIELPEDILAQVRKASSTTKEATFKRDIELQLAKWKQFFGQGDITRMQRVLHYFGIDVYTDDLLPRSLNKKE